MKFGGNLVVFGASGWEPPNIEEIKQFCREGVRHASKKDIFRGATPEGDLQAGPGDWITRAAQKDFHICSTAIHVDIFKGVA